MSRIERFYRVAAGFCVAASLLGAADAERPPKVRSIKQWVACDGVTDDAQGVAKAISEAKNAAFVLQVDCPVYIHVGMDIARPIFIDNDTTINFTSSGQFVVDNVLIPSFVIANTRHVTLTNWNIQYRGSMPVNPVTGGYNLNGVFVAMNGLAPPSGAFNDQTLTAWLNTNRGIRFAGTSSFWTGPADASAIFYFKGDTSNINISNMKLSVPSSAGADAFLPMAFSFNPGQSSRQVVEQGTPMMAPYFAVPNNLTFAGIDIDGSYFGWHGTAQNVHISNVNSYHYADLQDNAGAHVGGMDKWFSPPHLFYFNYQAAWDSSLYNKNITIGNVVDHGERVGVARDLGENDTASGCALSLKLGANNSSVSDYTSLRPDGFMDVLPSTNLKISNVVASYDSSFVNGLYPIIRFPAQNYHQVVFSNIALTDNAAVTRMDPIHGNNDTSNTHIVFKNTNIVLNQWVGVNPPGYSPVVQNTYPYFAGTGNSFDISITHR